MITQINACNNAWSNPHYIVRISQNIHSSDGLATYVSNELYYIHHEEISLLKKSFSS